MKNNLSFDDIYKVATVMMGNDTFIYGESLHGKTKKEIIEPIIKSLTEFMNDDGEEAENGYSINVEIFEKNK